MSILRALGHLSPVHFQSCAEAEAEIREELQFHLEMRTLDNVATGMSAEEAILDARTRFGDFEQNYRACRRATLGFRLVLQRLQTALLVLLLGTVVFLCMKMLQARADYQSNLQALTERLKAVEQHRTAVVTAKDNRIPYTTWDDALIDEMPDAQPHPEADLAAWIPLEHALAQPWCDWRSLEEPSAP